MGAGDYPVGFGPAGFDPASITAATTEIGADALLYDPFAHDIPMDANGRYLTTHWVDSEVLLALGLPLGTVKSAPLIGGTVLDLPISDPVSMTTDANRRVALALADLITAGHVVVTLVNAWASPSSRAHIEIVYQNLRLPSVPAQNQRKELTLGGGI